VGAERRRTRAHVDDDVEQRATRAVDVLGLTGRGVSEVDAPHDPAGGHAVVRLCDMKVESEGLPERRILEGRGEHSPVVREHCRLEHPRAGDRQLRRLHRARLF
jgi:hypothetical protein